MLIPTNRLFLLQGRNRNEEVDRQELICIFIKTLFLEALQTLYVKRDSKVEDIKKKISEIWDIPVDQQRLITINGTQLEDGFPLYLHNIKNETTIYLMLRLCGGMFHQTSGRADFTPVIYSRVCDVCFCVVDNTNHFFVCRNCKNYYLCSSCAKSEESRTIEHNDHLFWEIHMQNE